MPRIERASGARAIRRTVSAAAITFMVLLPHELRAQGGLLLQGVADGELWSTSKTSNLLTRNGGQPAALGRIELWGAIEPLPKLVFFAQGNAEGGPASVDSTRVTMEAEEFGVRYLASPAFVIDAGRLQPVIGTFAARRLSTRNPLIGLPDGYSLEYPYGGEVWGEFSHFDYRAAIVSLPVYHDNYVPYPTARARPAIGGGFTPITGLRFGASYTAGTYLNDEYSSAALAGKSWSDYDQRVLAFDFAYAVGYLETHAEFARGSYDVPGNSSAIAGETYYGEAKYTFTPRFFLAGRVERNDYPFIRAFGSTWVARLTDFVNGEVGAGYRVTASTLLKVSIRGDRWWIAPGSAGFLGTGGHAIAFQWSQSFDVMNWFQRQQ